MTTRLAVVLLLAPALLLGSAPAASSQTIVAETDLASARHAQAPAPGTFARTAEVQYQAGPVLHADRTHAIFWQPDGSGLSFEPGYISLTDEFLAGVAADSHSTANVFGLTGQYTDSGGPAAYASSFAGGVIATDSLPASGCVEPILTGPGWVTCVTDAQLQAELERVIAARHLPTGPDDVYVLLTPRGLGSCQDAGSSSCALGGSANGYCGYHSATASGLLYAVVPYNAVSGHCQSTNPRPNASAADPALSTTAHELAEIVTDPIGDGWVDGSGQEIADLCITDYGPALGGSGAARWDEVIGGHHYWIQELESRIDGTCEPRPKPDSASITGAGRAAVGSELTLAGRGAQPGGSIVAYNWSFGDGHSGRGRQVSHTYTRTGSEAVTMRVTDSAGNWAYATRTISVTRGSARDRSRRRRRRRR